MDDLDLLIRLEDERYPRSKSSLGPIPHYTPPTFEVRAKDVDHALDVWRATMDVHRKREADRA